ncbi:LuxR family transcriptional regulator [Serinibacter arcticus]|nr:LuxR family transcriptional regulator [Serinibacter arcticus]
MDSGLLSEQVPELPEDPDELIPRVVRTLLRLGSSATLVVDDLDRLPEPLRASLLTVASSVPQLHLLASADASWEPEVSLPAVAVVADLELSVDDIARATGTSAEVATQLKRAILGRPAGLRMVSVMPVGQDDGLRTGAELVRTEHHVIRAHDAEVRRRVRALALQDLSSETEGVLRSWALADPVTDELARLLNPRVAVDDVMRAVVRAGLARVERQVGGDLIIRLAAPVRATLRQDASPEDRSIHVAHANWALARRDLPRALRAAGQADDLALAGLVLTTGGLPLLWEHGAILVEHFERTPVRRLQQHPVVALALGLALNSRRQHRLRAAELFITAAASARLNRSATPSDRALMATVESVALRLTGLADGGVAGARRAASALGQLDATGQAALGALRSDLLLHAGIGLLYGDLREEAVEAFEAGAAAAAPLEPNLHAWALLAGTAALRGDLDEARSWRDLALSRPWPPDKIDDYQGTYLRVAQVVLALEDGKPAEAEAWLDRIWPILPTVEHWSVLLQVRAFLDVRRGRPLEGLERMDRVRRSRRSRTGAPEPVLRRLDETAALLHLAAGQPAAAERVLRRTRREDAPGALARGRLALAQGRTDLALTRLARASSLGLTAPRLRVEHGALEAAALLRLGRSELAERAVLRLEAQLEASGLSFPLFLVPGAEGALLLQRFASTSQGERGGSPGSTASAIPEVPHLTPREEVVLRKLVDTASTVRIAQELVVSANTVKSQMRSLYRKLGATNRREALAAATSFGLLRRTEDDGEGSAVNLNEPS